MINSKLVINKYLPIIVLLYTLVKIKMNLNSDFNEYLFFYLCIYDINRNKSCSNCSINIIYKPIKVKSIDETLNEIIKNNKSISRFGDGEFSIIFNNSLKFQKFNERIKYKLLEVLNSTLKNLSIGIMNIEDVKNHRIWNNWFERYKFELGKILNKNKIYSNSFITRFFTLFKNKIDIKKYISKFKSIWNNRNILIIEGDRTRIGVGNDLLNNSNSIKRIICPNENAFSVYDKILDYFYSHNIDKDTLILISLGPTATVLTYELCKLGFQSIDLGHFDLHYEFYSRNYSRVMKLDNKYVNEVPGGSLNISQVKNKNYYNEILIDFS